ncbi:hypothetical protein INR49_007030 [Caranx melampygus]|nr:hypothetical protein INR49_007030 [Caranx melampygus]
MAEEEVNYASVVFKNKKKQQPQDEQEETVYSEVKVQNKTSKQSDKTNAEKEEEPVYSQVQNKTSKQSVNTKAEEEEPVYNKVKEQSQTSEQSADTNASLIPDKKGESRRHPCLLVASFLAILCVILIAGIIVVCISFLPLNQKTELEQLKDNQTALLEENHNLTEHNNRLSSENANLTQNYNDLIIRFENLTEAYNLSELRVTNLTTKNQELKTQSKNLTQQIQEKETELIQSNVSRAEWSINAYCPIHSRRQCRPCQAGWIREKSSCYVFQNPPSPGQKTWTEAQEICRGKGSDLVVIADETEKRYVKNNPYGNRFWIGLRVVDGKWKWVDGSELNEELWWTQPAAGQCVVSTRNQGWTSVSCGERNQWICELAALSV